MFGNEETILSEDERTVRKRARSQAHNARLERRPCEICGSPKAEKHHEDYSKPLEVRWLCREHHMALHDKNFFHIPKERHLPQIPRPRGETHEQSLARIRASIERAKAHFPEVQDVDR